MADINISELPVISLATNDDVFIINDANATTSQITWGELQQSIQNLTGSIIFEQGSAAAPSITFVGDLNNGIFSPGLDIIGFTTNGTERMRIDESGNVGISSLGPSNYNSAANNLVVGNVNSSDNGITLVSSSTNTANIYFADGTGTGSEDVGRITYDHSDNHLHFSTVGNERLRINAVGNVGIGTSSIKSTLHVRGGDSGVTDTPSNQSGIVIESGATESGALQFFNAPGTNAYVKFGDGGSLDVGYLRYDHGDDSFRIATGSTEKVQLTSDGDLMLGTGAPTNSIFEINKDATGGSIFAGVNINSEIKSDVTTDYRYFRSTSSTQNASFNLTNLYHFSASQSTFGTNSTVETQYGFAVDSGMTGGVTNYGFHSSLNQGTNTYGFYAGGTADNYFGGNKFTINNGGTDAVVVENNLLYTHEGVLFNPGDTNGRPTAQAGLMRFNSDVASWEGYNGFSWGAIGGGATVTPTPPSNANEGDIWFDNEDGRSYIYYNDGDSVQWVEMNPSLNGGIPNESVSTPNLVDGAVTSDKILDLNVTNSKLATNSVSSTKIQNGAVTPEKLDRVYTEEAPQDGNPYVRQSGAWSPALSGTSASSTFPQAVAIGQTHYNTNDGRLYITIQDQGGNFVWVDASPDSENANVYTGEVPPADPLNGSMWWDTESGRMFIYYVDDNSGQWTEASPQVNGGFAYDDQNSQWINGDKVKIDNDLEVTGNIQASSFNGGQLAGFRNQLISGNFLIAQRGNDFPGPVDGYTFDRWICSGNLGIKGSGNTPEVGQPAVELSGGGFLGQGVELTSFGYPFVAGSTWTIGFEATQLPDNVYFNFRDKVGSTTNQVEIADIPASSFVENTALQPANTDYKHYSATFTVGVAGVGSTKCMEVTFKLPVTTMRLSSVQLEPGFVPTPFENRFIGTELQLCQRYFQKIEYPRLRGVSTSPSALNRLGMTLPTTLRVEPTVTYSGIFSWYDGSNTGTLTSFNSIYVNVNSLEFEANPATGSAITGRPIIIYIDSQHTGQNLPTFYIDAEL